MREMGWGGRVKVINKREKNYLFNCLNIYDGFFFDLILLLKFENNIKYR
jgi:hypothetical protein